MRTVIFEIQKKITEALGGLTMAPGDWSTPPNSEMGDLAFPMFKFSKALKKGPPALASELAQSLNATLTGGDMPVREFRAAGPYLNAFLDWSKLTPQLLDRVIANPAELGASGIGRGKKLIVEYSSPNIAKEIALHHLRSTAIGNALANIAELHGFETIRINYLGDWGTTHGKNIVGLKTFGSEDALKQGGLPYMLDIYVKYNQAEKTDPALKDRAREAFKLLEQGDKEHLRVWNLFRAISIDEYKKVYARLGSRFDHYHGESMYRDALDDRVKEIDEKIGTRISDGALICELPGHAIPVLLKKADGASLYITRDIAAIEDRSAVFAFDEIWYVVAVQQKLHFQQLFDLAKALGKPYAGRLEHISFGMLSFGTKTMKSREGNVIFLSEVLDEARTRAADIIRAKNPDLKDIDATAEMIGTGAILFNDLSQNRSHDISFEWEKALSFEGDTAPFIQYTHARCASLEERGTTHLKTLTKTDAAAVGELFAHSAFQHVSRELMFFEIYAERALVDRDPSQIATACLAIAKAMNQLYHKVRFLDETDRVRLELLLKTTRATRLALAHGLKILGIQAPAEM